MRKNFLLLFLMALLPLAGWAYDYEVQVTTYDGTATWTGAKPDVQPDWFSASFVGGGALSAAQKAIIATGLKVKDVDGRVYNAGTYEYQLALKGGQTISDPGTSGDTYKIYLNSSTTATLTINKILTAPTVEATGLEYVAGDLMYDGSAHALLATGATALTNAVEVPVVYATSATAETWYSLADLKETNAGTYTVYYKVAETINYAGSDPVAMATTKAIAQANTAAFNVEAVTGLVFDNTDQALVTKTDAEAPIVPFGAEGLQYQIDGGDWTALPANGLAGITGKSAKNAVAYSVKFKIPADASANANWGEITSSAINVTIAKATPTFTTEPTFAEDFDYDGQAHQLILNPGVAEFGATPSFALRYMRAGTTNYGEWIPINGNNWSENYQLRTATNAGYFQIAYCTKTTDDLKKPETLYKTIKVSQIDIPAESFTAPAANENLKANGGAQALITAGSWNVDPALGEFQYKVGEGAWNNTVPQETAAGTYTVYSKIVATSNYKNVDLGSVNVTIAAKDQVHIKINENQSFGYGTTPTLQYTANWGGAQGEDQLATPTWNWFSDAAGTTPTTPGAVGDYYVTLTGLTVTGPTAATKEIVYDDTTPVKVKITAGQVTASISGTATYGSLPTFTLTHVSGLSDTEAATFNAANNLATVTVKQGTTTVLNDVAKNSNDLKALDAGEYTLEATATLANYNVVVSAGTLIVNAKSIADATVTVTTAANDIVYNAKAWGTVNPIEFTVTETSGITANDYDVAYTNNVNASGTTDATKAKITLTGKNNYKGTKSVYFIIKKAPLTVKANDLKGEDAWIYGTTEPTDKYSVTVTGYVDGESLGIGGTLEGLTGALNVVRTSSNTVGLHTGALKAQFGSAQPAASKNYAITYETGDLQIAQAALTIKLIDDVITGTYGDNPADNITAAILTDKANYKLDNCELPVGTLADILDVSGVTFKIDPIANNKYEVNDAGYKFTMTGAITTNYAITISDGTYKVNPSPIKLQAEDQTINWAADPTATPNTTVSGTTVKVITSGSEPGLQCGDVLTDVIDKINIESTNVGVDNRIYLTAKDNKNYNITVLDGVLTVAGAADLAMTSDYDEDDNWFSTIQSYDGKPVNVTIEINRTQTLLSGKTYTWKGEDWNAFILPFDITPKQLSDAFGYAIVNVVNPSASTADNIAFKLQMSGTIEANTPFMLKNYQAVDPGTVINFGAKTIVAPASKEVLVDAGADWQFIGTYDKKTIDCNNSDIYYYNGEGAWKHLKSTSTNTWNIAPFNAYMLQPAGSPAREMTFTFEEPDGGTTAIRSISEDATGTNAKGWYDLKGMKMENAPTQKGVYIKDGKKVVIK